MLESAPVVAFVATSDGDRARSFYEGVLGLPLREVTPFAIVFDACGTELRVTPVEAVTPPPYTVLGWAVNDIDGVVATLVERGVTMERFDGLAQSDSGVWESSGGARIAWFKDPDGNLLSVTEAPGASA